MMEENASPTPPPSLMLLAREVLSLGELACFMASQTWLRAAPRAVDDHPVLVIPPFFGDDQSTSALRMYLSSLGHNVHGWKLGRNLWRTPELVDGVPRRLFELRDRFDDKVSLVGWSAGGIWAREMAREFPDAVRQVISMGSPFRLRQSDDTHAAWLLELVKHRHLPEPDFMSRPEHERPRVPVPTTAIYSRTDGVAHWESCIEAFGPDLENIEVQGTHTGLAHNVAVAFAIADRLAQREGSWQPFHSPCWLSPLFPPVAHFTPDGTREHRFALVA